MKLKFYAVIVLALTIFFAACQPQTVPQSNQTATTNVTPATANDQWDKYVEGFLNDYLSRTPILRSIRANTNLTANSPIGAKTV